LISFNPLVKRPRESSISNTTTAKDKVMNTLTRTEAFTHVVAQSDGEALEVFGPTVQFLTAPHSSDEAPCIIKGIIPPGGFVPIHSHPGIEAFFVISGQVEVFTDVGEKPHWIAAGPGDFIAVPGNAKHAFRNSSLDPVVQLITTTSKLGRFFQEIGRSTTRGARLSPPSPAELQHFARTSERYGYWLASSEENASAGISAF
jgi:quercetin dioxygenase-like cupin family protein